MPKLQEQARALGDPTRHAIFEFIVGADEPVDVAELTLHLGLNHNAIRQHLAKLVGASLVVESKAAPNGPGRPRLVYRSDPTAESRWGVAGPYERLSLLLTEVIRSGESPVEVGRRSPQAQIPDSESADDAVRQIRDAMAREGFDPEVRPRRRGVDIVLHVCPFASSALADPGTICQLHLGLAQGMAESSGKVKVTQLVVRDPRRARCRLTLEVAPDT